jgi:hypothetical protein
VKLLRDPEACEIESEHSDQAVHSRHAKDRSTRHITTLRWRDRTWTVHTTLEIWTYRGAWWLDAQLEGEAREYHVLGTRFGEIEIFARFEAGSLKGWFVSRYWD